MRISHKVDQRQVEDVLTQFEATTVAIRGIDEKAARMNGYVTGMREQRERLTKQAEAVTGLVDSMSDTLNERSDDILMFFTDTLDNFAGLVEKLEQRILELRLQDAPRQIQREFGPLLMPAIVLVVIITVSNCVFGFILAGDAALADSFSILQDEAIKEEQPLNILKLFAVLHMALIASAVLFVIVEAFRKLGGNPRSHSLRGWQSRGTEGPAPRVAAAAPAGAAAEAGDGGAPRPRRPARLPSQRLPERRPPDNLQLAQCRQRVEELRRRRHSWAGDANPAPLATAQRLQGGTLGTACAPDVGAGVGLDAGPPLASRTAPGSFEEASPRQPRSPPEARGRPCAGAPSPACTSSGDREPSAFSPATPGSGASTGRRSREALSTLGSERSQDSRGKAPAAMSSTPGKAPAATQSTPIASALRRFQKASTPIAERLMGVDKEGSPRPREGVSLGKAQI